MRTVKRKPSLSGICAMLGGAVLWSGAAAADVTSDRPAGLLVYPKLLYSGEDGLDTEIQLTNTSGSATKVRCFYVNANAHCSNDPETVCNTSEDCPNSGGICREGWQEIDFEFTLTPQQPIAWRLSEGLPFLPLDGFPDGNTGSVPRANEDPFRGELKCFQVGPDDAPVDRNDLKGEVTIVTADDGFLDARAYNAIGIQAVEGANNGDNTLVLGEEYNGCPNYLILDHFFDDAVVPTSEQYVRTDLTLVPCSQNFLLQERALFDTTIQFLVYNEFEQRLSASRKIRCFKEIGLTDIGLGKDRAFSNTDQTSEDRRSIFNVYVQGTLTGQTWIRAVNDTSEDHGNGVIGVAEEFHRSSETDLTSIEGSAAFNINFAGVRSRPDFIVVP